MRFKGRVVQGVNVGSKFGVATANLLLEDLPDLEEGVYYVDVFWPIKSSYPLSGLLHFGLRKTFGSDFSAEVHILDFNQDLYGQTLEIEVGPMHRPIKKFLNADQLFTQIEKDITQAKKFFIRRDVLAQWEAQSLAAKLSMAEEAVEHLSTQALFLEAKNVLTYAPKMDSEVHFTPALMQNFPDKNYWFPRVNGEMLEFYKVDSYEHLESGHFGIMEPEETTRLNIKDFESGLILVPALATDSSLQRLGRGGGYYDKFLATLPKEIPRVVILPEFAVKKNLPVESHDQPVDKALICSRYKA